MSIVSQSCPGTHIPQANRHHLWLAAVIIPLLIAPFWLALPREMLSPLGTINGLILMALLTTATYSDLRQRKIFNWTTYPALLWALAINLTPDSVFMGGIGLSNSLFGAATCFVVMLIPYSLARGGAGDVKLAAAIGALVGVDSGLLIIAFAYIVAAIMIAQWAIWTKGPLKLISAMGRRLGSHCLPKYVLAPTDQQRLLLDQPVPLAGFFAIATLLVVFDVPTLIGNL